MIQEATSRRGLARVLLTVLGGLAMVVGALMPFIHNADDDSAVELSAEKISAEVSPNFPNQDIPDGPRRRGLRECGLIGLFLILLGGLVVFGLTGRSGRLTRVAAVLGAVLVVATLVAAASVMGDGYGPAGGRFSPSPAAWWGTSAASSLAADRSTVQDGRAEDRPSGGGNRFFARVDVGVAGCRLRLPDPPVWVRSAEQEPLGEAHAKLAEVIEVGDVLHAFGAHLGAERARIGHQPLQYGGLAGLAGAAVHQRPIRLDDVGAQGSHPVELANAGAEIVQSDGCTPRAKPRYGVGESSAVDVLKVFGELHHNGVEAGRHPRPEPTGGEGTRGGVDVEGLTNRSIGNCEGSGYSRGLEEVPVSVKVCQAEDSPRVVGRSVEAGERLVPGDSARGDVDDRLQHDAERGHRRRPCRVEGDAAMAQNAVAAGPLGLVERLVGARDRVGWFGEGVPRAHSGREGLSVWGDRQQALDAGLGLRQP